MKEGRMKNDDFKLLKGFADERMNTRTDICDCRVAFATEKTLHCNLIQIQPFTSLII